MGNENSKSKVVTKNGKNPEKHENGSVNGLSHHITSNGLEISAELNGETVLQQNGGTHSLDPSPEPAEPDYVIVNTDCQQIETPVISEILETAVQKEEVKKSKEEKVPLFGKMFKKKFEPPADVKSDPETETSKEDQPDTSLPPTDLQPELGSSEEEAAIAIVAEHRDDFEHQRAETSTQTDRKTEADISTQTGEDDANKTTKTEWPVEEVVAAETTEEDSLSESVVVIAEEVVEETADEEPFDKQMAGIIIEEVVIMENNVYDNIMFRAERVEVTDNFETNHTENDNPEEEGVNEAESTVAVEASDPNESITEGETVAEENNVEEVVPPEISFSLPKVMAGCVEAVFLSVSESMDTAALNTPEPSVGEVITEDNCEGARDMSADAVLIETVEPEPNVVPPEAGGTSLDKEPVTTVLETISEGVCEVPNLPPANQDMPAEGLSDPFVTEVLVMVESALEMVTAEDAVEVEDAPTISEEFITVEVPSNELITIEELPEDTSSDVEVEPESIPEGATTDESAEVSEDVVAGTGPEKVEEAEPSLVVVRDDVEVIPEAAIDALSQGFELTVTLREPELDNSIPLIKEVIVATTYVPLSGEREASPTIPEEPTETVAEEVIVETIVALSNELEAVPECVDDTAQEPSTGQEGAEAADEAEQEIVDEDTTVQESSVGKEVAEDANVTVSETVVEDATVQESSAEGEVASSEETVEEKTEVLEDVLVEDEAPKQSPVTSDEPVEDNPNPCEEDAITEVLENLLESVVEAISENLDITENITEELVVKQADVPQTDTPGEPETSLSVQEELIEANVALAEELLEDVNEETSAPSVISVEEPIESSPVILEEPVEDGAHPLEPQVLVVVIETTEDGEEELTQETDHSGDVLAASEENSEDFKIATANKSVEECVDAVLETILEEIISEDVVPECDVEVSEERAPEIIIDEETEADNSTDSTQSADVTEDTEDMEGLFVRLQSACTSAIEESAFKLDGLKMSSSGYSITFTIHVALKEAGQ